MAEAQVELMLLRQRVADLEDRLGRLEQVFARDEGAILVQTATDGAYPSATGVFFKCQRMALEGTEKEGGSPSYTASSPADYIYAVGYGASVPAQGTDCLAVLVPYRWVVLF